MEQTIYKVYAHTTDAQIIDGIESTAFHAEDELMENGYVFIDEGSDGRIYGHAQPNYLLMKYGQPKMDDEMRYNYKLVGTTPTLLTDEEKQTLNPPVEPQPTEQDLINADIYMQLAQLQMGGMLNG